MTAQEHIDQALEHLRAAGHLHGLEKLTREHIEYAAAHCRQAWIVEDGQKAMTPQETFNGVAGFYRLQNSLLAAPQGA